MANNRIYIRCRRCYATLYLGKHFGSEYYWENYSNDGKHLEDKLNDFFKEHFCCNPLSEFEDLACSNDFELCEESDDDFVDKFNRNKEFLKESKYRGGNNESAIRY